jgi:DNA-binding Lrp family transcriptional regulator
MNSKILRLIENNARMSDEDIATAVGRSVAEVKAAIRDMEQSGIIRGYKTIIDREKLDENAVSATIELKVVPKAERGFEEVAERIALYPEVESVSLMSGGCDLSVVVTGKTFRDVSIFVAKELATIDAVTATATQFIMRRYKDHGVLLTDEDMDERDTVSL